MLARLQLGDLHVWLGDMRERKWVDVVIGLANDADIHFRVHSLRYGDDSCKAEPVFRLKKRGSRR